MLHAVLACVCAVLPSGAGIDPRLVESIHHFGTQILRERATRSPRENVVMSPLSLWAPFAMAAAGAAPDVADEMWRAMGLADPTAIREGVPAMMDAARRQREGFRFESANAVWSAEPLVSGFDAIRHAFRAQTIAGQGMEALSAINGWVNEQTHGEIPRLLDDLPASAVFVLLNATYFKGQWASQFDPERTRPLPFHRLDGTTVETPMMQGSHSVRFKPDRDGGFAVAIPFREGLGELVIVVPSPGEDPALILDQPVARRLEVLNGSLGTHPVVLPKLRVESEHDLGPLTQAKGMRLPWAPGDRFPGIASGTWLAQGIQKAVFEMDEEGATAAAATAIVGVRSAPLSTPRVDRPFYFAVVDKASDLILFEGLVYDPVRKQ